MEYQRKGYTILSDNVTNIVAAIRFTGWKHLPCFAHTLNLIVQDSLKEIRCIQDKVKGIVEYFHRSTVA